MDQAELSRRATAAHGVNESGGGNHSLATAVRGQRDALLQAGGRHGVTIRGVFGSVARVEDSADSDVDLLVDLPPRTGSFWLGRVRDQLEGILGVPVDLVPFTDLRPGVHTSVLHDLVPH